MGTTNCAPMTSWRIHISNFSSCSRKDRRYTMKSVQMDRPMRYHGVIECGRWAIFAKHATAYVVASRSKSVRNDKRVHRN